MIRTALPLVILISASYAQAEHLLFVIEHERTVQASADDYQTVDAQNDSATDTLPWVAAVMAGFADPGVSEVTADGGQYSEIGSDALHAYGLADTTVSGWAEAVTTAGSVYRIRFAVAETVNYHLTGSLDAYAVAGNHCCAWELFASATASLDQIAGPSVFAEQVSVELLGSFDPVSDARPLDQTGTLSPGVYEFEIRATVDMPYVYSNAGFEEPPVVGEATFVVDLVFAPAAPSPDCTAADINADGTVDLADYAQLQTCYTGP